MIRITMKKGMYEARTFEDLVSMMKWDMYTPPKTRGEYMEGVASRSILYDGREITFHDCESFVKELVRIGVINKLEIL